jgi:polar amino acid transport system substrate-binding protein
MVRKISQGFAWTALIIFALHVTAAQAARLTFSSFEGSPGQEMSVLILKEAYASIGIEVEVIRYPGLRSLKTANEGRVDGEVSRVKAFERDYPNLIPVPVPVNHLQGTAFSKNGAIELRGWESLRDYTVGITRGMKFAERGTAGMAIVRANSHQQLFQLLDKGRVDVAINPFVNGVVIIKKLKLEGIYVLEPPLVRVDLYHFLHKRHAALVPKITDSIRKLEASGRIDEIRKQFFQDIAEAAS